MIFTANWGKNLQALLKKTSDSGVLDAVIDSGGGDVFGALGGALKSGGRVVCYGMYVPILNGGFLCSTRVRLITIFAPRAIPFLERDMILTI